MRATQGVIFQVCASGESTWSNSPALQTLKVCPCQESSREAVGAYLQVLSLNILVKSGQRRILEHEPVILIEVCFRISISDADSHQSQ